MSLYYFDREKLEYVKIPYWFYAILLAIILFSFLCLALYFDIKFGGETIEQKFQEKLKQDKYKHEEKTWEYSRQK